MAGNIVKWWRHKILGGYKHFSGFHECPTDTEELIYPIRAPSSCSAPPDLLLTSDREQIHIRCPTPQSHHHHHHHHQNSKNEKNHNYHNNQVQTTSPHVIQETDKDLTQITSKKLDKKNLSKSPIAISTINNGGSNINNNNSPDRVHLEEFTCDVSVEGGGKTPQPLQFSFTLYDLDGHGKITKDDIAGIVSTIYESIGKTVVVPHYGSKTINVRLTVSPDGKKVKERERTTSVTKKGVITPRRRVRQRKLISDDDGSDTSNDCVERRRNTSQSMAARNIAGRNPNACAATTKENVNRISKDCSTTTGTTTTTTESTNSNKQPQLAAAAATSAVTQVQQVILNETQSQNIYDSIQNLKFYSNQKPASMVQQQQQLNDTNSTNVINLHIKENNEISCQDCKFDNVVVAHKYNLRKKLLRKSRSRHKQHKIININNNHTDQIDKPEPRVRSLSVGNENCYNQIDDDGNDENFWKSSLRRHELFEIIRESMEKNRLCFQANRKPVPDTSPSNFHRHRHRSHTITKMIDENNLVATTAALTDQNNGINHPLPETNLCGYDSFLHATICANNNVAPNTAVTPGRVSVPHHHHNGINNNVINNNLSSSANNKKALKLKNHHHHHHHSTSNTPGNVYTRLNPGSADAGLKLNTTILSQLNPNLTSEQKFNRTINHVEKWLTDRDHQIPVTVGGSPDISNNNITNKQHKSKLVRSKSKEEINLLKDTPKKVENLISFDKLKITEDTTSSIGSCANAKKSSSNKLQQHHHHHVHSSPVKSIGGNSGGGESVNKTKTGLIMEYASIPVNAEPSECENLLRCSDEDTNNPASSSVTPSTVHRYVHEHIHHHYHHFENDET